jgi:hypothetical protein
MNSNVENKSYKQKDISVNNIYLVMKKINETISIDEKLKRRTRNGGYIAWPNALNQQNLQERNNA